MKHYGWLSPLLFASLALGQGAPATSAARPGARLAPAAQRQQRQDPDEAPAPKVPLSAVPESAAVVTINGLCSSPTAATSANSAKTTAKSATASKADCKTVLTRAQFEKLADALNPQMPLTVKRQLAEAYPRMLLFAKKAHQVGLDKDPQFQEMQRFANMQLLAQYYTRNMEKKAGDVPDTEVQKFYNDNPTQFQEAEMLRIFVPKAKQHAAGPGSSTPSKSDAAADEAAMKATAEKIHSEAVAGGDFQKLQKEAFDAAGIQSQSPSVSLGKITHEGLPTNHQKVFDLQAGQVSELLDDPGGFYIYKVVSKQLIPLNQAKGEIRNYLKQQAYRKQIQEMISSVQPELNQTYFGGQAPPAPGAPKGALPNKPPTPKPGPPAQK
ncbi:MAG TPA: peptidyl-prolyl cis-trans isomerase [Terriglobales bacterium]|nr:peptidyl-prolyl cis-trans isomerase [Terriglobales bacterium]